MEETQNKILAILKDRHPEVEDFLSVKELVHQGILNSLDIVRLVGELSDTFDIQIPPSEINYDNFDTVEGLTKMVERLKD